MSELVVGGFTPITTIDYPGQLAAVVFCQGCPWRCHYCHNRHLLPVRSGGAMAWSDVLEFLERRRGLLDAVVFSGGEPLNQPGLAAAMGQVRALGFKVGLHTAGTSPAKLEAVLPLTDWIGIDAKAPFDHYPAITRIPGSGQAARMSAQLVLESGIEYEFRTTVAFHLLSRQQLLDLAGELAAMGVKTYAWQAYRSPGRGPDRAAAEWGEGELLAQVARWFPRFIDRTAQA